MNVPSLIQIDQKYHIISKASDPMRRGHGDNHGEEVVDECIERLEQESSRVWWRRVCGCGWKTRSKGFYARFEDKPNTTRIGAAI
ncbi:hypothetical protein T265_05733 [Opisthorchis viverrini]|uniref:Uncharacterized protein n=1 Tax=Opisthorchis viverrini TaxID=6198 RepID=A0A074ZJP3_OPIVI|nr:hypothetical protein T265_05733 [Opisthorchis viverrini]KER27201.1 hypothetical protein T265_05733 [Opisthorchis viverrini]